MKKISIVIVTYNSYNLIQECLESIFKYNNIGEFLSVIIVDNASDDWQEMSSVINKKYANKNIILIDAGENGGYGKGNNIGIRKSDADIVCVMNPDVRFVAPIFESVLKEFEDPNLGLVGVNFVDGSMPYYFKPEHSTLLHTLFLHLFVHKQQYNSNKMYMSGSLLFFDRKSFWDAGGYDEKIFMYYEEPDITNRLLRIGKKIKWLKDIKVLHLAHGRKYNHKLTGIRLNSLEYYCSKYHVSTIKIYKEESFILHIKRILAKLVCDKNRFDVFDNTLKDIKQRIKLLR